MYGVLFFCQLKDDLQTFVQKWCVKGGFCKVDVCVLNFYYCVKDGVFFLFGVVGLHMFGTLVIL